MNRLFPKTFPTVPLSPYRTPGVSVRIGLSGKVLGVSVKPHPAWAKFLKKYPTLGDWLKAHPGEVIGRLVGSPPEDIVYYSVQTFRGKAHFDYTYRIGTTPKRPLPKDAIVYETYKEWKEAIKDQRGY